MKTAIAIGLAALAMTLTSAFAQAANLPLGSEAEGYNPPRVVGERSVR